MVSTILANLENGQEWVLAGRLQQRGGSDGKNLFNRLVENMTQMDEIDRGERQPTREFRVDAVQVKKIRQATGLSQARLTKTIDVAVGTLRNWEQGRREPEGPARALLRAIHNAPSNVLAALKQ
jgi:putative transcriptional regulator